MEVFGRATLTNGSWKMRERLILLMILLSKEIFQIFLCGVFFLTRGYGLSNLESIMSNPIKNHLVYRELLVSLRLSLRKTAVRLFFNEMYILANQKSAF